MNENNKIARTMMVLDPGSDEEQLLLMLIDVARLSVAALADLDLTFVRARRAAAGHALIAVNDMMVATVLGPVSDRLDYSLIGVWLTEQADQIGFDLTNGALL